MGDETEGVKVRRRKSRYQDGKSNRESKRVHACMRERERERERENEDLVLFKIPTFHLLILSAAEQVWLTRTYSHTPYGTDVSCQCQLQPTTSQVPQLNKQRQTESTLDS